MIELDVMVPCETCYDFNPVLVNDYVVAGLADSVIYRRVTCEHMVKCKNMLKHLKECEDKNGR